MSELDDIPEPPRQTEARTLGDGIAVLPAVLPVPGLGRLAVNAFVFDGTEPLLVDTGLAVLHENFVDELATRCDPAALCWIWISHMDADHTGNLVALLEAAPRAKVLTSFLGQGKMMLAGLPVDRVQVVEDDVPVRIGERELLPLRPPYYDAPETLGFLDRASGSLFVADAFGAVLPEVPASAEAIAPMALRHGLAQWSALDAPWLALARRDALQRALDAMTRLQARRLLSAHLPPAPDTAALCRHVMNAYDAATASVVGRAA